MCTVNIDNLSGCFQLRLVLYFTSYGVLFCCQNCETVRVWKDLQTAVASDSRTCYKCCWCQRLKVKYYRLKLSLKTLGTDSCRMLGKHERWPLYQLYACVCVCVCVCLLYALLMCCQLWTYCLHYWYVVSCGLGSPCIPTWRSEAWGRVGQLLSSAETARRRH